MIEKLTKYRQNFLNVDGKIARSSLGDYFEVGELVGHEDNDAGTATILSFTPVLERNEIRVDTDKGYAHLDFLVKLDENGKQIVEV